MHQYGSDSPIDLLCITCNCISSVGQITVILLQSKQQAMQQAKSKQVVMEQAVSVKREAGDMQLGFHLT
jgi:hypothetical protein